MGTSASGDRPPLTRRRRRGLEFAAREAELHRDLSRWDAAGIRLGRAASL